MFTGTMLHKLVYTFCQMVWLYKDPKGENIFTCTPAAQRTLPLAKLPMTAVDNILSDKNTSDKEKIDLLVARVRDLESQQVTKLVYVIKL